ncbi:MAG: hypothetical protein HOP18_04755 [Deltaproteobacteria bacterium]|nr:hypothetical protein [Deltaproteobacteria bacterium]
MRTTGRRHVVFRLCTLLAFVSYLLAGVSFALPSEMRCGRCFKQGGAHTMKPGTSCPLSHHTHHNKQNCHDSTKKQGSQLQLCPDGCLRYDGQGGEVPSVAKFLSTFSPHLPLLFVGIAQLPLEPWPHYAAFPPPDPPPSRC